MPQKPKKKHLIKGLFFSKKHIILFLLFVVISFEIGSLFIKNPDLQKKFTPAQSDLKKYAQNVINKCKNTPLPTSCFDKEIPKLMDYISMRDAFGVAKIVSEQYKEYTHCHVLGHELSGIETKKDPSKWKDVITQCPAAVCNNGCLHGPLLTRFNKDVLTDEQIRKIKPDLFDVCDPRGTWHPLEVETSMCYHGMGHLNMYITGADVNKSVDLCKYEGTKPNGKNYVQTCIQGVFMEIYQSLEPEDIALVKNIAQTKESVPKFCSQFTGEAWGACHRESWALYQSSLEDPKVTNKFCSYSSDALERRKCFSTVMSSITIAFLLPDNDLHKLDNFCKGLDHDQLDYCYGDAAQRLVQIDTVNTNIALGVCKIAPNNGNQCYSDMIRFGTSTFQPNSSGYKNYCGKLPAPWDKKCLNKDFSF